MQSYDTTNTPLTLYPAFVDVGTSRICETCKVVFIVKNRSPGRFCSHPCYAKSLIKQPVPKSCKQCQKLYFPDKNDPFKWKNKFCSRTCHKNHREEHIKIERECLNCGKKFRVFPSKLKEGNGRYCSISCGLSKNRLGVSRPDQRGENSTHWQGGTSRTNRQTDMARADYREWRRQVYERDNHTCTRCNKRGSRLNAHHILDYHHYPDLRYEVSNGTTLCVKCHKTVHVELHETQQYDKCACTRCGTTYRPRKQPSLTRPNFCPDCRILESRDRANVQSAAKKAARLVLKNNSITPELIPWQSKAKDQQQ